MLLRSAICLLFLLLPHSVALAEKRVALVIGNGAYVKAATLPNPKNDALAMADLLGKAGFDVVDVKTDLSADGMRRALRDFSEQVWDADMAVVFYAGHGMEMNGVNYLIPVDATLARDVDVEDETVSLERVIRTIEPVRRLQLVILDACRDNPFVRSMRRTFVSRSLRSGHGDIDERALPPNTLIAYAQKAGLTAEDGDGADSPYTTALLKHLATPGLDIELALRRVRDEVLNATRNRQEPFKYGSLGGAELPLVPSAAARPTAPPPSTAPVTPQRWSEAAEAWDRTKDSTSIPALEAFMARFTGTYYADLARLRIEDLRKQSEAQTIAPPSNGPASQSTELVHSAADTLERVMPAVVAVQLKKPGNATDTGAALSRVPKDAHFEDAFFEEFFNGKGTRAADAKDEVAHVSGFFISDEGLIVTRLPAIEPTQEISVIDDHGANYKAKLVGRHVETKIALLKIDSSRKFPRVAFSNRSVTIGEYLLKASNPFGLVGSASVTKVSGWQSFSELPQSIELNTPINKGEAGAAIFDLDGEVVGVGMGSRSNEKGTDHAGYALPANVVNYVVDQLRRTGAVLDRSGLANEFNRTRGISSTPANRLLIGVPSASVNNAQAGIVFISMGSGSERNTSVLGSGFVIDGKDGIIVTNNHVIEGADEIIVNFSDGNKLKVDKVLGKDTMTDLAVLKVTPKKPLASLPFGSSAKIRVGDWVMAIGSSVTVGIISAKQRNINSGPYDDYLQNDVAINKGKRGSGSPLFNMDGEVIGVNTAILSPTGGFIGIGFALPSDTAVVVIDQLRQYGEVRRGWLGVTIQTPEREDIAGALGVKENSGALVASVTPGSPAAKAGMLDGDVILKFDGKDVSTMRDLPRLVATTPIGSDVDVEVLRKGQRSTLRVAVGRLIEQADPGKTSKEPPKNKSKGREEHR